MRGERDRANRDDSGMLDFDGKRKIHNILWFIRLNSSAHRLLARTLVCAGAMTYVPCHAANGVGEESRWHWYSCSRRCRYAGDRDCGMCRYYDGAGRNTFQQRAAKIVHG